MNWPRDELNHHWSLLAEWEWHDTTIPLRNMEVNGQSSHHLAVNPSHRRQRAGKWTQPETEGNPPTLGHMQAEAQALLWKTPQE